MVRELAGATGRCFAPGTPGVAVVSVAYASAGRTECEARWSVAEAPACSCEPTIHHAEPGPPVSFAHSSPASVPVVKAEAVEPSSNHSGTALPQASDARGHFRSHSRSRSRIDSTHASASHYNAVTLKHVRSRDSELWSEANQQAQHAVPAAPQGHLDPGDNGCGVDTFAHDSV